MSSLLRIRQLYPRLALNERRLADFLLSQPDRARHLSSQKLAEESGVSQSSVVKFTQKLGFKGYPDLKYSVGEAIARADNGEAAVAARPVAGGERESLATSLWRRKSEAEEATRLINPPETLRGAVEALGKAGKVFVIGVGEDDIYSRGFALKLSMLGIATVQSFDVARMMASISSGGAGDVLLIFSEHGHHPALCKMGRLFREQRGRLLTVTRHTSNPLRALADLALLVSAHDEQPYVQSIVYQSALQHLLDGLFIELCEGDERRHAQLLTNLERLQLLLEP